MVNRKKTYATEYYSKNRNIICKRQLLYYRNHKETILAKAKKSREANPGKYYALNKRWLKNHPEYKVHLKKYQASYYLKNKAKLQEYKKNYYLQKKNIDNK